MISLLEELGAYSRRWLTGLLVLGLSLSLPLALAQSSWVPGLRRLLPVAAIAALLGLWAGSRRRGWWLAPLALVAGCAVTLASAANAWPLLSGSGERLADAVRRLAWWAQVLWVGGATDDPMAPLLAAGLAIWAVCFWLGWEVQRHGRTLAAVLPAGAVLAANTFFGLGGSAYLLALPPAALVLMAQSRAYALEGETTARGGTYPARLNARFLGAALTVAALVAVVGAATPFVSLSSLSKAFWARADRPWKRVVRLANWVFPAIGGGGEASSWLADNPSAAMPSARALTGEVSPGSTVVMRVHTSDPPPPSSDERALAEHMDVADTGPTRYWRGMTYDTYTGRGWANSKMDIKPAEAGSAIQQPEGPRQQVTQDYRILVPHDELLFAVADPVTINVDSRPRWRGSGDFAFVDASVGQYSVVSAAPDVTERQLREAGADYPQWVQQAYLQLPDLPQDVIDLAQSITANATTPYDKLLAIQDYLRQNYTYDLSVPTPVEDEDVVYYFLFVSRRGYCDYYASAMVVMARALGMPARLASGYATGGYDYEAGEYVVRESDAHSWPQAYFPGYGWIDFEPTVSQETIYRPSGAETDAPQSQPPVTGISQRSGVTPLAIGGAAGAVLALGGLAYVARRRARIADRIVAAYASMERSSDYLGLPPTATLTPREMADRFSTALAATGAAGGGEGDGAAADVAAIAAAYERRRYARWLPETAGERAVAAWVNLRRRLRPLLLRRAPAIPGEGLRWARRRLAARWSRPRARAQED